MPDLIISNFICFFNMLRLKCNSLDWTFSLQLFLPLFIYILCRNPNLIHINFDWLHCCMPNILRLRQWLKISRLTRLHCKIRLCNLILMNLFERLQRWCLLTVRFFSIFVESCSPISRFIILRKHINLDTHWAFRWVSFQLLGHFWSLSLWFRR